MKIDVVAQVDEIKLEDTLNKTVIVIDVLRATSTIVTALAYGAKEVIPVETIGQARSLQGEQYLLAAERFGKRVAGFPFTNSPTEMASTSLSGLHVVLTTTNGTRAIQKCLKASHILIGSFLNGTACSSLAVDLHKDVTILCAGSRQNFAMEDGMAAGFIVKEISNKVSELCVNDLGMSMVATYEHFKNNLEQVMQTTATGRRLLQNNNLEDIAFCAQRNLFQIVPVMKDGSVVADIIRNA